jgi:putative hemolysin
MKGAAARDISYADSVRPRVAQVLVRGIENATGRSRLIRLAKDYDKEVAAGGDFWEVMCRRYGVTLDLPGPGLANLPKTGPLIVIANHPYGILDGLALGRILAQARGDFRILANRVFRKAEDLDRIILPISFDGGREAQLTNIETRRIALDYLRQGGAIGIFPGGTVSTAKAPFSGRPMDPAWRTFTARLIAKSGAAVCPVFFDGCNSRRFQIASHVHPALRLALLINEFRRRIGGPVRAVIGGPVLAAELAAHGGDPRAMMDWLRRETYKLSPTPLPDLGYGYEFEDHVKGRSEIVD